MYVHANDIHVHIYECTQLGNVYICTYSYNFSNMCIENHSIPLPSQNIKFKHQKKYNGQVKMWFCLCKFYAVCENSWVAWRMSMLSSTACSHSPAFPCIATHLTVEECPCNTCRHWPHSASHTCSRHTHTHMIHIHVHTCIPWHIHLNHSNNDIN